MTGTRVYVGLAGLCWGSHRMLKRDSSLGRAMIPERKADTSSGHPGCPVFTEHPDTCPCLQQWRRRPDSLSCACLHPWQGTLIFEDRGLVKDLLCRRIRNVIHLQKNFDLPR